MSRTVSRRRLQALSAAAVLSATLTFAGSAVAQDATWPARIPAAGGEVIIPSARHQDSYDQVGYAPARRVGDTLYVSGVILYRGADEGTDLAAFEIQTRRAFRQLDTVLKAAGASFDDVVMINSFHVWEGRDFSGTRMQQIEVMNRVRAGYTSAPHPAWTAVGTTGLLAPTGIVEIQVIAHAPQR